MTASDLIRVQESHVRRSSQAGMSSSLVDGGGTNLMIRVLTDDPSLLDDFGKVEKQTL